MKAIEISQPGGPDVLVLTDRPTPQPGPGEVLIKVAAAGVNRPDVIQRQGYYPPPPGASDIPGLEVAGEIVEGDAQAYGLAIGDQVCALVTGGGYAEYCVAPAAQCLPIPKGLSLIDAAGLPETYFTVWSNVFDRARLKPGETLLVHGGASGIGTTAIQLATALGSKVYATAGSDDRARAVEALGAVRGINYRTEDFVEVIRTDTHGKGVDVVLDMVAGDYVNRNFDCLAEEGRAVIIAFLGGTKATIDCSKILLKRLTLTGSALRARPIAFKADIARSLVNHVWPLLADQRIKPVVHATFPLAQAADAHALMESSQHIGKIVLTV